jgi:prophage regulatory protein
MLDLPNTTETKTAAGLDNDESKPAAKLLAEVARLNFAIKDIATKAVVELLGVESKPAAELLAARLPEMLLRIDTVCNIIGLSVPTVYRLMSEGQFPRPLRLTGHARAWRLSDVMGWIASRPRDSAVDTGIAVAK